MTQKQRIEELDRRVKELEAGRTIIVLPQLPYVTAPLWPAPNLPYRWNDIGLPSNEFKVTC